MNSNLDKTRVIEVSKLDSEHYFQSLLEQAYNKGVMSNGDIERLQCDCLNLLAYKSERYNAGDSGSIRIEKAQDIMKSILFTISLWLKTYPNPDDAVTALQHKPINEIYEQGRKRIDIMLASAKEIHAKLLRQLVETPNVFYSSTIDDEIKRFFKLYYPDFAAHEIHITAAYQTFNPMLKLAGIEFIHSYLNNLYYENLFCSYFAENDIHHLLCGFWEDYERYLINIYEPVLLGALGCAIIGTDLRHLDITEYGEMNLCRQFADMTQDEIAVILQNAADEIIRIFDCSKGLVRYLQDSLPLVITKVQTASQKQTLNRVFVLPSFPENKPQVIVSFGNKMDDERYREIIEEIRQCRFTADKVGIINEHIHSLADLEDVFLDADLTEEETGLILQKLSLSEIAALSKQYMSIADIDAFELRPQEQLFRKYLLNFIAALPQKQQDMIIQVSKIIKDK